MRCVRARTSVEKARKERKAESLEYGRRVDAEAKRLTEMLGPVEKYLSDEQARVEVEIQKIERAKADKIYAERLAKLTAVEGSIPESLVREMSEVEFAAALKQSEETTILRKETEARLAKEESERKRLAAEEAERNRVESERLAAERAELDRQRAEQQKELNRQREEQEASARAERERLDGIRREQEAEQARIAAEKQKLVAEAAERERQSQLEKARQEAAENARIETEQRLAREAEESKRKAAEEEASKVRAEQLRPDREKIAAIADSLDRIEIPDLSSPMIGVRAQIREQLQAAAARIRKIADNVK
jgi:hypothetical protein